MLDPFFLLWPIPIKGGDRPRKSETKKDIDTIAACYIADGIIRIGVVQCRALRSKGIWQTCAQGHDGDSGDIIWDAHATAIKAAKSPTIIVTPPIIARAQPKQAQPPAIGAGGTNAKSTFHGRESK